MSNEKHPVPSSLKTQHISKQPGKLMRKPSANEQADVSALDYSRVEIIFLRTNYLKAHPCPSEQQITKL
jgi:hypothetical protein